MTEEPFPPFPSLEHCSSVLKVKLEGCATQGLLEGVAGKLGQVGWSTDYKVQDGRQTLTCVYLNRQVVVELHDNGLCKISVVILYDSADSGPPCIYRVPACRPCGFKDRTGGKCDGFGFEESLMLMENTWITLRLLRLFLTKLKETISAGSGSLSVLEFQQPNPHHEIVRRLNEYLNP